MRLKIFFCFTIFTIITNSSIGQILCVKCFEQNDAINKNVKTSYIMVVFSTIHVYQMILYTAAFAQNHLCTIVIFQIGNVQGGIKSFAKIIDTFFYNCR